MFGRSSSGVGFFGRLKTGWNLALDSFSVLRSNPILMVFPAVAGIAALLFLIGLFVPAVVVGSVSDTIAIALLFVYYLVATFVSTYCTAALVYGSNKAFHGEDVRIGECFAAANQRLGPIVIWSVIAATVSIILNSLEDSDSIVVRIITAFFAAGWTIMTFFMIPVIVFEDVSVTSMFSRSLETFKKTWGETLGAGFGVGLIVFLLAIPAAIMAVGLSVAIGQLFPLGAVAFGAVSLFLVIVFAMLLSQTVNGIMKTALYMYATEGRKPSQFDNFDFETLGGRTDQSASVGSTGGGSSSTGWDD
jgi:hypothetical protein